LTLVFANFWQDEFEKRHEKTIADFLSATFRPKNYFYLGGNLIF